MNLFKKLFSRPAPEPEPHIEPVELGLPYDHYPEVYLLVGPKNIVYGPYRLRMAAEFENYNNSLILGCFVGDETWRQHNDFVEIWLNAAPTTRTAKQLKNAGLAARTEIEALKLLKSHRAKQGLTPTLKKRLVEAGIPDKEGMTRAEANELLKEYQKEQAAKAREERVQILIERGFPIETPISDEDLESFEETGLPTEKQLAKIQSKRERLSSLGVSYAALPKNLSQEKAQNVADTLDEALYYINDIFRSDMDFAWFSREPTHEEKKAIGSEILKEALNDNWPSGDCVAVWKRVFKKAAPELRVEWF